jgi:HK97 family phage portal protein
MKLISLGLSNPETRGNPLDNPSVSLNDFAAWEWFGESRGTDAGELINDHTALKISTVFACTRVLSESVASLPLRLLKITPTGLVRELVDPLYSLLAIAPNVEMTGYMYWQTVVFHMSLTGNSFSEIERSEDGTPIGLWPLNPRLTRAVRMPNGDLAFETQDGETGGNKRIIAAADCLHIPLMSFDGIVGLSPIMQAARALGLAAASEKFGSRLFANNATPQIALKTVKAVKPEDKVKMRADWESLQSDSNQHRVAILDADTSIQTLSITPDEAQFLQTRVHQRSEICAIFRVPPHMVGSEQKLSNSNVEQMNLAFITDTLRPILSCIEAEVVKKLMPPQVGKAATLTAQFDLSERQRGDSTAIAATVACGRQWGALTANESRLMLGKPALPEPAADCLMVPVNMQNIQRLLDEPKAQPTAPIETVVNDEE